MREIITVLIVLPIIVTLISALAPGGTLGKYLKTVLSICAAAVLIPMFFSLFGIARDAAVGLSDSLSVPAVSSPSSAELIRSDTENGIVSLTSSLISDAIDAEISRRFGVSSSTELFCDASDPANVVIISALVTSDGDCDASAIQSYVTSLLNCPCEVILR